MNIGIDVDGVLTDYEFYLDYFAKKLDSQVCINPCGTEPKKRFDWSDEQVWRFYKKYFLWYVKNMPIRVNVAATLRGLKQKGHDYFFTDTSGNVWGCTGDIGYVDEDGFVFVLGRANDTFVSKNHREVYCFDIENAVLKNENVAQCEVVGLAREGYSVPVAHMILEENCTVPENEIIEAVHRKCLEELEEDEIPCGYKICKSFPVKRSGKRDMELIKQDRERFWIPTENGVKSISF